MAMSCLPSSKYDWNSLKMMQNQVKSRTIYSVTNSANMEKVWQYKKIIWPVQKKKLANTEKVGKYDCYRPSFFYTGRVFH